MFGNKRLREAVERLGEKVARLEKVPTSSSPNVKVFLGRCACVPKDYPYIICDKLPHVYSYNGNISCDRCGREYTLSLTPVERRKKERGK